MNVPEATIPEELAMHLLGDERIAWWGRPYQGIKLGHRDLFLIPFSCLWSGITIFWVFTATRGRAPVAFLLVGIVFLAVGLFLVFGRFLVDSWLRRHIWYALTDRRAMIIRSGPWPALTSLNLLSLPQTSLGLQSDGAGTISFAPHATMFGRPSAGVWIEALDATPRFIGIRDAARVFAMLQTEAQRNPSRADPSTSCFGV